MSPYDLVVIVDRFVYQNVGPVDCRKVVVDTNIVSLFEVMTFDTNVGSLRTY